MPGHDITRPIVAIDDCTVLDSPEGLRVYGHVEQLREHREVMRRVEQWWLSEGQHKFASAPDCMSALRHILEVSG